MQRGAARTGGAALHVTALQKSIAHAGYIAI